MARPLKWSRDLHSIRERALRDKTETWSRTNLQDLFNVGPSTAQTLMKAIGEVQPLGGAHFVERGSLLGFLEAMILAPDLDEAFRKRLIEADAAPPIKALRIPVPEDRRSVMIRDLPANISLLPGKLEITADSAYEMLENLAVLARALQNDMLTLEAIFATLATPPPVDDDEFRTFFAAMRSGD